MSGGSAPVVPPQIVCGVCGRSAEVLQALAHEGRVLEVCPTCFSFAEAGRLWREGRDLDNCTAAIVAEILRTAYEVLREANSR